MIHPGGIQQPDGYELVMQIPVDDGSIKVQLHNLLRKHQLDIRSVGVTVCLDRYGRTDGIIHGRLIHDHIGTAYVFRKDFPEEDLTHLIVEFSHQ